MSFIHSGRISFSILSSLLLVQSNMAFAPPGFQHEFSCTRSLQGSLMRRMTSCVLFQPRKNVDPSDFTSEDLKPDKGKVLQSFEKVEENAAISRRNALSSIISTGALFSAPTRKDEPYITQALAAPMSSSFTTTMPSLISVNNQIQPLIDLPMRRIRLPSKVGVGRDYVIVQLSVNGKGPFDFMVDSGLTTDMITPHLQKILGLDSKKNTPIVKGLAAGGNTMESTLVKLSEAALCCVSCDGENPEQGITLPLPPLYAVVSDFPQEHLDPEHDPVEGMLGMEMIDLFDVDFDFAAGRIRFWAPGTAAAAASQDGLEAIPAAILNESGLLGIRVKTTSQEQPVLGIIDCGSSFSAVNWAAAGLMGLPVDRSAYRNEPSIMGVGVDGRPQQLPTKEVQLTFAGNASQDANGRVRFESASEAWNPWDSVRIGIGDLPVFSELLGDGKTSYKGPAALIGLDVLAQRRFILETGKTRKRRILVSPS